LHLAASGEIWVVLRGKGHVAREGETIAWRDGDILLLPGGGLSKWAAEEDAVLWMVSDEPALAFMGVRPEAAHNAAI
jgi:gentisate 1,2-dioxygenase